ncbi:MAG: hypothetical protein HY329_18225 [Chloroflexi bacterium]|nr:hypothetical protein [Chloroflexota bacterium]
MLGLLKKLSFVAGEAATLTLRVDETGRQLELGGRRWRDAARGYQPFGGHFLAERAFAGYTIPSEGSLGWGYGTDEFFEFFRYRVEEATFA